MAEHVDVALCTAACVVWSKTKNQTAEVQRCLAISIIAARSAQQTGQGTPEYKFGVALARAVVEEAAREWVQEAQQNPALAMTLEKLLQHNAFLECKNDVVNLRAPQLLGVAIKAYQANPSGYSQHEISAALSPGSKCVRPGCENLAAQTVHEVFSLDIEAILLRGHEQLQYAASFPKATAQPPTDNYPPEGSSSSFAFQRPAVAAPSNQQDQLEAQAAEHWPSLPMTSPAPKKPSTKGSSRPDPISVSNGNTGGAHPSPNGHPSPSPQTQAVSNLTSPSVAVGGPSTPGPLDNTSGGGEGPSVAISGFRSKMGVGYGDDNLLWGPILDNVRNMVEYKHLAVDKDELVEVLSLGLAVITLMPATSGAQIYRMVMALAIICCPPDIAIINKGRHRCMKSFIEKLTYWCNKRLMESGVSKGDLVDEQYIFNGDAFFFSHQEWVVLRLRQLAGAAVRIAEAPRGAYPSLPFPPTMNNLDVTLQHNQSKTVFVIMQRLLQPPTRMMFALAALDVLKRLSSNEASDQVAPIVQAAQDLAAQKSNTPKFPPSLLAAPATHAMTEARAYQAANFPKQVVEDALALYKASPPPPPGGHIRGAGEPSGDPSYPDQGGPSSSKGAKVASGIIGADYVQETKVSKAAAKAAAAAAASKAATAAPKATVAPAVVGAAAVAAQRARKKQAEVEKRTANAFGLLEEFKEEEEEEEEGGYEEEEEQGYEAAAAGANNGTQAVAGRGNDDKYRQLLAMAGLIDSESDEEQDHRPPPPAAPARPAYHLPPQHQQQPIQRPAAPYQPTYAPPAPIQPAPPQPRQQHQQQLYTNGAASHTYSAAPLAVGNPLLGAIGTPSPSLHSSTAGAPQPPSSPLQDLFAKATIVRQGGPSPTPGPGNNPYFQHAPGRAPPAAPSPTPPARPGVFQPAGYPPQQTTAPGYGVMQAAPQAQAPPAVTSHHPAAVRSGGYQPTQYQGMQEQYRQAQGAQQTTGMQQPGVPQQPQGAQFQFGSMPSSGVQQPAMQVPLGVQQPAMQAPQGLLQQPRIPTVQAPAAPTSNNTLFSAHPAATTPAVYTYPGHAAASPAMPTYTQPANVAQPRPPTQAFPQQAFPAPAAAPAPQQPARPQQMYGGNVHAAPAAAPHPSYPAHPHPVLMQQYQQQPAIPVLPYTPTAPAHVFPAPAAPAQAFPVPAAAARGAVAPAATPVGGAAADEDFDEAMALLTS